MDEEHRELWQRLDSESRIEYLHGEVKKSSRQIAELYALSRNSLNFEKLEKSIKFWGGLIAATILLFTFLSQAMSYFNNLQALQKQQLSFQERVWEEEHNDRYRPYMSHEIHIIPYFFHDQLEIEPYFL